MRKKFPKHSATKSDEDLPEIADEMLDRTEEADKGGSIVRTPLPPADYDEETP